MRVVGCGVVGLVIGVALGCSSGAASVACHAGADCASGVCLSNGACGPVMASRLEVEQLGAPLAFHGHTLNCVFLNVLDHRCLAYHQRPMICRVYGVSRSLPCAHGCVPDRWLTDAEGREFVAKAMAIGGGMVLPDRVDES